MHVILTPLEQHFIHTIAHKALPVIQERLNVVNQMPPKFCKHKRTILKNGLALFFELQMKIPLGADHFDFHFTQVDRTSLIRGIKSVWRQLEWLKSYSPDQQRIFVEKLIQKLKEAKDDQN